nr:septum formation family protein [Nocardioides perillae]
MLACAVAAVGLSACGALAGAGEETADPDVDPAQVDAVEVPELGACRVLTPDDVQRPSDATRTVPCSETHTAETFAVGPLPGTLADAAYDDRRLGQFAYDTCGKAFTAFLGGDESAVLRSVLSWAWFRPSPQAWEDGARWYRCDVVGGPDGTDRYAPLPTTARGLLRGQRPDDRWTVCAAGPVVAGSEKVACSEPHDWRAVTTVKLGDADDDYPGDRLVEVRTRDFCSDSVGAFLGYPLDFDFGYTWFGQGEWEAGNRRSICWAKTPR